MELQRHERDYPSVVLLSSDRVGNFPVFRYSFANLPLLPSSHCEAGMVFAVNPNAAKTFSAFQAAAMASSSSASAGGSASASATGNPSGSSGAASPSASSTNANGAVRYSGSAAVALAVIGLSVAALL